MYATPSMAPEAHHKSVLTHAPGSSAALEFAKRSRAREALEDALPQGAKQYANALAEEEMDVESLPLCSEADLVNLGLPTGPRLKIMGHFGILRADGSLTSNHYRQAPPSPSSSLHRGGGEVNSPGSSHDDALYGLQNEVARLAEVVEALQRSNNGISDALNRVEMENAELRSGHRELFERQARLAKRHSKLHASVFSRKPTDKEEEEVDEEVYFETGRFEIDDDDEEEEEEALSEYAEIGQGFGGNHSVDNSAAANDLPSRIEHLEYEDEDTGSLVHPEDMAAANAALAARDFMRRQQHREDRRNQAYDQEKEHHQDDQDDQEEVDDARGTTSKEQRKAAVVRRAAEVAVGARRAAGASSTAVTRAAGAAAAVDLELRRWSPPSSKVSSPHSPQSSKGVRSPYQPSNNQNSVSTPPSATSGGGGSAHVARSPSSGAWSSSLRNRSPELSVHSGNSHKDYYGSGGGGGGGSPLSGGGTSSIGSLSERQAWAAALDAAEAEAANKEKEAKRAADREKREAKRQEEALRSEEAAQWANSFANTTASSVPPVVGPSHTSSTGGTWVNHGRGTTVHALEEEWAQEKALRDREGKLRRDERQKVMEEFERGAAERAAQARAADEKVRAERERIAKARADAASKLRASEEAAKKGAAAALEAETSARLAAEEQARRDKYKGMAQELSAREALKSKARQAEILKTHQDRQGFVPSSAKQQQLSAEEEEGEGDAAKIVAGDGSNYDYSSKETSRNTSRSRTATSSRSSSPRPSSSHNNGSSSSSRGRPRSRSSPRDGSRRHSKGNEAVADMVHPSSSASVDSSSTASSSVAPPFIKAQTSSSSAEHYAPYSNHNNASAGPTPSKEQPRQSVTSPNDAHVAAADKRAAEMQAKGDASVARAMSTAVAQRQSAEIKAVIDRNRPRTTALRANIVQRHATPTSASERSSSRTTIPVRTSSPRPASSRPVSPRSSSPRPSTAAAVTEAPAPSPVMPLRWFS